MIDPYMEGIREATWDNIVAHTWDGKEVYQGDEIWKLGATGDIVNFDTDDMKDYLEYRIRVLGGVDKWIALDLNENYSPAGFIISLFSEPLSLSVIFEDYYDGDRVAAQEG